VQSANVTVSLVSRLLTIDTLLSEAAAAAAAAVDGVTDRSSPLCAMTLSVAALNHMCIIAVRR